jgi:hypothetical protein
MGILGEIRAEMIKKLQEVAKWQAADSTTAIPFTLYCSNSTGAPGRDNIMRMPFKQIDTVLKWAKPIDALVF